MRERVVVGATWVAAAGLHARNALSSVGSEPVVRLIGAALVVAAVAGVVLLATAGGQRSLLFAAVVGAVGVATWFLPLVLPGLDPPRLDVWTFGAVLLDALTVRLAVFALHRGRSAELR